MEQDFDKWNEIKKKINRFSSSNFVHEREIWWCSIGKNIGDEENGKNDRFERPVLVLRKPNRDIAVTVPISTQPKNNQYNFVYSHNGVEFSVIVSQIRLLSTKRFNRRIRKIGNQLFDNIRRRLIKEVI